MKTLKPREKVILAIGGIFLVGYIFAVYVASPILEKQKKLEDRIENKQALISKYYEILNREDHYKKKNEAIDKMAGRLQHMLLVSEKPALAAANLQKKIEEKAQTTRVDVLQVRPQQSVERGALLGIPVQVSLKSTLKELALFIRELENETQFLVIQNIRLQRIGNREPELLKSDLVVEGFVQRGATKQ